MDDTNSQAETRACPECGATCAVTDKFCDSCGVSLPRVAAAKRAASPPPLPPPLPARRAQRATSGGRGTHGRQAAAQSERVRSGRASREERYSRRPSTGGSSLGLILGVGLGVILLGGAGWFLFAEGGGDAAAEEMPIEVRYVDGARHQITAESDAELEARIREFESAWQRDDHMAIKALFEPIQQSVFWPKLERMFERHGWTEDLPDYEMSKSTGRTMVEAHVRYELETGYFKCRWSSRKGGWQIKNMTFKDLR